MAVLSAATVVAALIVGGPSATGASDTLSLPSAIVLAIEANPMLRAERLGARASTERIAQAGAWPNPEIAFGLINRPIRTFNTEDRMTMNTVRYSQGIPWPGKQRLGRSEAAQLAVADALQADDTEGLLAARVTGAYYDLAATDRTLAVMRETLSLLRAFRETALGRYAAGGTVQQDVLQAEVNVARMEADVAVREQERLAQAARFNALLARDPATPVGALRLPVIDATLPSVDTLAQLALGRPALAAADARIRSAESAVASARKDLWPDLNVSLEYGSRSRFDDMMSVMVGVSVPVFAGSNQLPRRREMEALQARREAEARDLLNETWARLTELHAVAERAVRLDALYATRILPQAAASVEAALSAYRVGGIDFMTLAESRMAWNRFAIERIALAADYHIATSEIRALTGAEEVSP